MYTSYTSKLNEFKNRDIKLKSSLVEAFSSQRVNISEIWNDENISYDCLEKLATLGESTENVRRAIEQYNKLNSDVLSFLEEVITELEKVIKKLESMEALSIYRDVISDFFIDVRAGVGAGVWDKAESAINKKFRFGKVNFKKEDEEFISKLQNFLQEFNLTVEDIELMVLFKRKSNTEFHQGERLGLVEVREKFETSFPESLISFKEPMRRVLDFLNHY
ncbi:hypothetical protein C1646_759012 [Rhizophagus diaphanus]|nr:hypothetical protein C1646_759012 [Rhizophagus diaphanus] [Rhizophagus sp. MUCL 43196]